LGLLGADLEFLPPQIRLGLGPDPTVLKRRGMFYMLANIHHQIVAEEELPPPHRFWYVLPNLPYGIQNAAGYWNVL
jgi:hypothetical protein